MPFKSKAQARKMFVMEGRGELKKGTAEEFAHATKNIKKLPEHVKPKKKGKKK
jgi:hypothetical protein